MRPICLLTTLLFASVSTAQPACTPQWSSMGGVTGVDNQVSNTIVWDRDGAGPLPPWLVVAGFHDVAGNVISPNLAAWDGTQWIALNTDGLDGGIDGLAIYNNDLIVGGIFSSIDGVPAENVARLTPTGWQPLGAGLDNRVYTLGVYNNQIFASGEFSASGSTPLPRLARWNGSAWVSAGSDAGADEPIMAFTTFNGELIAAGGFTSISDVPANRIARWNGTFWSAMGAGVNEQIRCATVFNNQLHIGGSFTAGGETPLAGSARWNGTAWEPLFPGEDNTQNLYNFAQLNGELFATGTIATGGFAYTGVARLTPTGWSKLSADPDEQSDVFASYAITAYADALHVSGLFRTEGNEAATRIARWTGDTWAGLGTGNAARVFGGISFQNKAIMYGDFRQLGGVPLRGIAAFDGSSWTPLGAGITDPVGTPGAACIWNDNLVVVGNFGSVDNQPILGVAIWNGSTWSALAPLAGAAQGCAVLNGSLYVGGLLYDEQGNELGTVVRYTGSGWEPVGTGTNAAVYAVATYDNKLYVGGDFDQAGGISANGIAAWNGSAWESLGSGPTNGVNGTVGSLFVFDNQLIVGARLFTQAGGIPASSIARWNGSSWAALGNSLDFPATITSMIELNGKLLVGGLFERSADVELGSVGLWDPESEQWSSLGSGTNQYVTGFARVGSGPTSQIIAGGLFTIMDGQPSAYVARLACPLPTCDDIDFNNNDVFPEDQDVIAFFNVLAGDDCPSCNDIDFNNNRVFPEDQDVIDFFNVLAGGECP